MPTQEQLQQLSPEERRLYNQVVSKYGHLHETAYLHLMKKKGVEPIAATPPPVSGDARSAAPAQIDIPLRGSKLSQPSGQAYRYVSESGYDTEERRKRTEEVAEIMDAPRSATGFRPKEQFGAGTAFYAPQPLETKEQARERKATASQGAKVNQAILRNEAIKDLAEQRGVTEADIRKEIANQGAAQKQVEELSEQKLQQFLSAQQQVFARAIGEAIRKEEDLTEQEKVQAIQQGTRYAYMEWLKKNYPEQVRELQRVLGGQEKEEPDYDRNLLTKRGMKSLLSDAVEGALTEEKDGQLYESWGMAGLRTLGGLTRVVSEPAMQALTYEADPEGRKLDEDDFGFFPAQRTAATGAERAVEGDTLGAQIISGMRSGRMLTDDLLQLQAIDDDDALAFGAGLVAEMLLPVTPFPLFGGALKGLGKAIEVVPGGAAAARAVTGLGEFTAHPLGGTAAALRMNRRSAVAAQFGIDRPLVTAKEVLASEVVEDMIKNVPPLTGTTAEKMQILRTHLDEIAEEATLPEVKRAVEAMYTRADEAVRKTPEFLDDGIGGSALQDIMEEEVSRTLLRQVSNDVFMPTPGLMITAAKAKELAPKVDEALKNAYPKEDLLKGRTNIDIDDTLWNEAKKSEYFFEAGENPQGLLNKVSRNEELTSIEADSLRNYVTEQFYLNPARIGEDVSLKATRSLGLETPTRFARGRMQTPDMRRLQVARDIQDVALGASVPFLRAAKRALPGAVAKAEQRWLESIKTGSTAARLSAEIDRVNGIMQSLPKRFKDQLKQEYRATKDVAKAYENVLKQNVRADGNYREFYKDFLVTFFSYQEKGARQLRFSGDEATKFLARTEANFFTQPPTLGALERFVASVRKSYPDLARRGMQRGLVFKEDAIIEAAAVATMRRMANQVTTAELKGIQRRYPDLFTKILKGTPPDVSSTIKGVKAILRNLNFKVDVADGAAETARKPGFMRAEGEKFVDQLTAKIERVTEVGSDVDVVIEDIVNGILTYMVKQYDRASKQAILEKSLDACLRHGTVSSNDIYEYLFGAAVIRSDAPDGVDWAAYREFWNQVKLTFGKEYDDTAMRYARARRNVDIQGKSGGIGIVDGEEVVGLSYDDIWEMHRKYGIKISRKPSERIPKVVEAVGNRRGLFEYKQIVERLREDIYANKSLTKDQKKEMLVVEANRAFDYIEKELAAYELFRELFRTVSSDVGGNIAADLAAQIIGVLNKSGFRTNRGSVGNTQAIASVINIQDNIFTFGTPELSAAIRQLQEQAIDGTLARSLDWLQRNNQDAASWAKKTISGFFDMSKRAAMAGMLGGFGPIPVTRFHFLNFFSFPLIQAVTNPGMVFPTLQAFFRKGVIRRTLADEFEFNQAMNRWVTSAADEVVVRTPSGGMYTVADLRRIIDESGLTRSGLSFEFSTADLADMRRVARLSSDAKKQGRIRVTAEMFNPVNKSVWTRLAFAMDGAYREATLIAALTQGRSLEESINVARNALLDYGGVHPWELAWTSRYMYFYTFWRMNATETLKALARSPEGALKNIRRMAVLSRELKKKNETLDIEPPFGLDRLWSYRGEDYDRTPSIYGGMAAPALSAVMQLAPAFNFIMGTLEGEFNKAAQQEFNDFSGWLYQRPDAELLFKWGVSLAKGDFFRDNEPASYVPARLVTKLKLVGMWDFFVENFDVAPVSDPRRMIPGKETVDGQQWRFSTKSAYFDYLWLNLFLTYAGINRAVEESLFAAQMDGRIPYTDIGTHNAPYSLEDVNLKRYKDGNFWLYLTALETPIQGVDHLQQRIKVAEAQRYLLRSLAKPD